MILFRVYLNHLNTKANKMSLNCAKQYPTQLFGTGGIGRKRNFAKTEIDQNGIGRTDYPAIYQILKSAFSTFQSNQFMLKALTLYV